MTDPWSGSGGRATHDRATVRPPRPRAGDGLPVGGRVRGGSGAGGRAAARKTARSGGGHRQGGHGQGDHRQGGRGHGRARPRTRGRRALRVFGIVAACLLLVTGGAAAWFYEHLNGNIRSVLLGGGGGSEKADAFGRTPINILVIGSDSRASKADCALGGACGNGRPTGLNADVEMVVHISADRSNATVMSIPRDTMVHVPACAGGDTGTSTAGYYGMVNSALTYGAACQVTTVHQLTGITIDHFVMLDFAGVVRMSDAVGGVSVCVDNDVYDTYSHLKLAKGAHTLQGVAALEFVRSRHGFGDGSDLGRTVTQHLFLGALIRKFKSAGTLTDPTKVYALADAATKALTVDTGLASVSRLVGLAADLSKVPSKHITFATMQTMADPADVNRRVIAPAAGSLFAAITDDRSLSGPSSASAGKKKESASAVSSAAAVPAGQVAVRVENGTGASGRASVIASELTAKGFSPATTYGNAPAQTATTTLTYGPGQRGEAATVAKALGLPASHLSQGTADGLTLVIGTDWPSGGAYPGGASSSSPGDTHAAVADASAQSASESKCAKVSPYRTVSLNGVPMTPEQAYAEARNKPDSAP